MERDAADETLMLRYRDGDVHAFERLYARHKGPLYRYLLRQCGEPAAAELFQEVWLKVIRARANYTVQAKFTTWLYRLAHNRVIDHYRANARTALVDTIEWDALPAGDHTQPDRQADCQQQLERLLTLLDELPAVQREAFLLHEEAGLSLQAIAEVTGANRETVKSRLRYAVAKLRRGLGISP